MPAWLERQTTHRKGISDLVRPLRPLIRVSTQAHPAQRCAGWVCAVTCYYSACMSAVCGPQAPAGPEAVQVVLGHHPAGSNKLLADPADKSCPRKSWAPDPETCLVLDRIVRLDAEFRTGA